MSDDDLKRRTADAVLLGEVRGTQNQILVQIKAILEQRTVDQQHREDLLLAIQKLQSDMDDVPKSQHHEHHDFVASLIARHNARAELCRDARRALVGPAAPLIAAGLLATALLLVGWDEAARKVLEWIR